jgi:hypothetical protein
MAPLADGGAGARAGNPRDPMAFSALYLGTRCLFCFVFRDPFALAEGIQDSKHDSN